MRILMCALALAGSAGPQSALDPPGDAGSALPNLLVDGDHRGLLSGGPHRSRDMGVGAIRRVLRHFARVDELRRCRHEKEGLRALAYASGNADLSSPSAPRWGFAEKGYLPPTAAGRSRCNVTVVLRITSFRR